MDQATLLQELRAALKVGTGVRPIYHQTQERSNGHLSITVVAYQLVRVIRRRLREQQENRSWCSLREILAGQQHVTASFRRADGSTLPAATREPGAGVSKERVPGSACGIREPFAADG